MFGKLFKIVAAGIAILAIFVLLQTDLGRRIYYKSLGVVNSVIRPGAPRAGNTAAAAKCRENLREIERAKRRAAQNKGKETGYLSVVEVELAMGHKLPRCPLGGNYTLGALVALPTCSISTQANLDPKDDHFLKEY